MNNSMIGLSGNNSRREFSKLMEVPLPDLGEGTKEATVKEWFVKPGDKVKEVSNFRGFR